MKPYDYSGGGHSNIHTINKWGAFCGRRREHTLRATGTAKRARRTAARRARRAAWNECQEGGAHSHGRRITRGMTA